MKRGWLFWLLVIVFLWVVVRWFTERALHYIYEHVNQFYNFKGLHQFKEKFHPHWSPRYLAYPGMASLPAVAITLVRADSGADFAREYLRNPIEGWRERRERGEVDEGDTARVTD